MLRPEQRSLVDLKGMYYANHEKHRLSVRSNYDVPPGTLCTDCLDRHSCSPGIFPTAAFFPPLTPALDHFSSRHLLGYEYHLRFCLENTNQPGISLYHCPHFIVDAIRHHPDSCVLVELSKEGGMRE